jgi:phage terminase small subunit
MMDVPILVAAHRLKPLGNPPPNSVKYFATLELLEQIKDRTWLAKVANALNQYWQRKNAAKKNGLTGEAPKQHSSSVNVTMTG